MLAFNRQEITQESLFGFFLTYVYFSFFFSWLGNTKERYNSCLNAAGDLNGMRMCTKNIAKVFVPMLVISLWDY